MSVLLMSEFVRCMPEDSVDTFATTGGLQLWDTRKRSCRQSDLKWGMTGASQDIGKVAMLSSTSCRHVVSAVLHATCLSHCLQSGLSTVCYLHEALLAVW